MRLEDPACPLYWLEVRWLEGGWGWRAMGAEERTHGGGSALPAGWRALHVASRRVGRVRLSTTTWIELVTAEPPRAHLVALPGGEVLDDDEASRWAEVRPEAVLPLSAEGDPAQAYADGHVLARDDAAVRVHAPGVVATTLEGGVDLSRSGVFLDLDTEARVATFSGAAGGVSARGECVRVLDVYLEARRRDVPRGGWLSAAEAHAGWVARGGNPEAPLERISWERCRLRSVLARGGAVGVGSLFEVAPGRDARVRLAHAFDP